MTVLKALPQDLRQEIIKEYKLEDIINAKKKENKAKPVEKPPESKSLFSSFNYEQLKHAIKTWIHSESKPGNYDVRLLGEHFRELAINRKIGILNNLLKFLHRYFITRLLTIVFLTKFCL